MTEFERTVGDIVDRIKAGEAVEIADPALWSAVLVSIWRRWMHVPGMITWWRENVGPVPLGECPIPYAWPGRLVPLRRGGA